MARQAVVRGIRTECATSSSVAEKESMSWWGSWDRKPMVSTYSTVMRLGSGPAWTVTSRVANSWSLGCSAASPVSAFIRVVFPGGDQGGGGRAWAWVWTGRKRGGAWCWSIWEGEEMEVGGEWPWVEDASDELTLLL